MSKTLQQKTFSDHLKFAQIRVETQFPESKIHVLGPIKRTLPIATFAVHDGHAYCGECGNNLTHYNPFLERKIDTQCPSCNHYISPLSLEELGRK